MQKNETGPLTYTYTKLNSKCIKDLNVRHETIKLLEKTQGKKFHDNDLDNDFLDMTPKAQATKAKIDKGYTKLKRICIA